MLCVGTSPERKQNVTRQRSDKGALCPRLPSRLCEGALCPRLQDHRRSCKGALCPTEDLLCNHFGAIPSFVILKTQASQTHVCLRACNPLRASVGCLRGAKDGGVKILFHDVQVMKAIWLPELSINIHTNISKFTKLTSRLKF